MKRELLILGAGGLISQGIMKSLGGRFTLVAADIYPDSPGLFRADTALICPLAHTDQFMDWLEHTIWKYSIKGILTGVEPILDVLSIHQATIERWGAKCVVSPPDILEIGQDKLKTAQWLKTHDLPHPRSIDPYSTLGTHIDLYDLTWPVIAKLRRGRGSFGIQYFHTQKQLEASSIGFDEYMVQEVIGTKEEEYTVGCFCDKHGDLVDLIAMKRSLFAGTTSVAEVSQNEIVRDTAKTIIGKLKPIGPCNLQMRLADGVAYTFEINTRFSSSTPMRAHFGFNESLAAVEHFIADVPITSLKPKSSGYVLRYFNEMYIPEGTMEILRQRGNVDKPWNGVSLQSWV